MLAETVLVTWAWELTAYGTKNTPVSATALHGQPKRWFLCAKSNSFLFEEVSLFLPGFSHCHDADSKRRCSKESCLN